MLIEFLIILVTPLIIWNTVKDGFERRNQLILVGSLFVFCALPISFFHFAQHLKHFNKPILQVCCLENESIVQKYNRKQRKSIVRFLAKEESKFFTIEGKK